ncbi:MAG: hypothetical protein ACERKV_03540 [Clostridiaceae bacterium]
MKEIFNLTKVLFKTSGSLFGFEGKNKTKKTILFLVLILFGFLPLAISFTFFINSAYNALSTINQQGVIVSLILSSISLVIFVMGIFYILNVFYFSKDIENLLPLPIKSSHILSSKFIISIFYELIFVSIFYFPAVITYGVKDSAGVLYYLYMIMIFFILPVIPLTLATIIDILVMRFSNLSKHKELAKVLGGILALVFAILINIFIQKGTATMASSKDVGNLILEKNSLIDLTSNIFFTSKFATTALVESFKLTGFLNFIIFMGLSILFFYLISILGNGLYIKGVIGISESHSKRKKLKNGEIGEKSNIRTPIMAYVSKEMKPLFRTSVYFINCILMNFIWPVFLLIPIFTEKDSIKFIMNLNEYVQDDFGKGLFIAILCGLAIFISATNLVSPTSISRDGKDFYVSKYLPISYRKQILAKLFSGIIISSIGVVILLVLTTIIIRPNMILFLEILILLPLAILVPNLYGIIIDLFMPKLKWESEAKAVKQNMNGVISIFISMALAGIPVIFILKMKFSYLVIFFLYFSLYLVIDSLLFLFVYKKGPKIYDEISF